MSEKKSSGMSNAFASFIGWGISTILLMWLNRKNKSSTSTEEQQPSKFTSSNANQIGSPVPAVLGRCMVKSPLISYYGAFGYKIYTEEYGMHSGLSASSLFWPILINIIASLITDNLVITSSGAGTEKTQKYKNQLIVMTIIQVLSAILMWLFNRHGGRTTIQKGFLYYLGWQHIICWTGDNIGLKSIWMNVYDPDVKESTQSGVWDNGKNIAWKKQNYAGITAYIDNDQMFGGWDEGGGFTGEIRIYFGHPTQGKDAWMVTQMTNASTIPQELRGLTPVYPMYMTAVISNSNKSDGAYIGKQATIPEMWFEVVNYPTRLADNYSEDLRFVFAENLELAYKRFLRYFNSTPDSFKNYMSQWTVPQDNAFRAYMQKVDELKATKDGQDDRRKEINSLLWD